MSALSQTEPTATGPTAFVLAGGGSLGAVQLGMLRVLIAHGVRPDLIVGSSVGSINGAYLAGAPDSMGVANLERLWKGLRRSDVFPLTWRRLITFARRRDFLVPSDPLRRLIDTHLPYRRLEEARVPVHVVATDFLSGAAVVLSRGAATDAILASSAIPAAFAPMRIGEHYLCDGAVTSNTPVRVAVALGARRLIVLPTGFSCSLQEPPRGAIASALHAVTLLTTRQLVAEIEALPPDVECHVVPTCCPLKISAYDFSRAAELIERTAAATASWLERGGLCKREIPLSLRPHHHDRHGAYVPAVSG